MKQQIQLSQVKDIPLEKLKPHPKNDVIFKVEAEGYFQNLTKAMKEEGQRDPIVVDKNYKILCGHNRFKVAKFLKWKTIQARMVTQPIKSETDEIKIMVSDNINRRQFGPADRLRVYQIAFPDMAERIFIPTHGAPKKGAEESFGLNARQISEKTGINVRVVSADLKKFKEEIKVTRGLSKNPIRMGSILNKTAISSVKRHCTGIIRSTLEENRKTQEVAIELVQETLNHVRSALRQKRSRA